MSVRLCLRGCWFQHWGSWTAPNSLARREASIPRLSHEIHQLPLQKLKTCSCVACKLTPTLGKTFLFLSSSSILPLLHPHFPSHPPSVTSLYLSSFAVLVPLFLPILPPSPSGFLLRRALFLPSLDLIYSKEKAASLSSKTCSKTTCCFAKPPSLRFHPQSQPPGDCGS